MSPMFMRIYFLVLVTTFLIIDYFPNIPVLSNVPGIVFFILLIVYLILVATTKKAKIDQKSLKIQMYIIGYVIVIGIVCMFLGEESQAIISFTHGVFWFSILIALFELGRDYSFFKRNENKEKNKQS